MKKALALDVGGTKIYNAIINENGEIISEIEKHATPKTFDEIKKTFIEIIKKHENDVDVIAFSTCGAVNNQNSKILGSTGNIAKGYPQMPFLELSTKPVFVENDANCAAWAEHEIGASVNCPTSVMITLGTGVGGGIIIDNKLLKGQNGAAGEMHFKMYSDKRRKCTCGSWDCFEIYASGTGLKITAQEMVIDTYPVDITDLWQYGAFLCWSRMGLWQAWTMGDTVAVWLYSQVQFPFRKNDDHAQGELYPLVYQSQERLVL